MNKYWNKHYHSSVIDGNQVITLIKNSGGDWATIKMQINGEQQEPITVKSRDHLEMLGAMISQCLREDH